MQTRILLNILLAVLPFCASGRDRARDILVEIAGRQVYIALPEDKSKKNNSLKVIMAIHGSGRTALSYFPGKDESLPFYVYQRDLAVKNGFLFVVVSNGHDTWGTDKGLEILLKVYDYVTQHFSVNRQWVLWGTSAGGVQMFRLAREHGDKVKKIIGTFPVYDLLQAFEHRRHNNFVWKNADSLARVNPANYPSALTNVPMLIFHGRTDTAVPPEDHSCRLKEDVNSRGGKVRLILVSGGHSTSNWNVYDERRIGAFLRKGGKE